MVSYPKMYKRGIICYPILAAISLGIYLLVSSFTYRIGFPLDDAWIHQTYARNLAERWEWSFVPGQVSAGSTAPLWSGLLAVGYFVNLDYLFWTFLVGWGLITIIAIMGSNIFGLLIPERKQWALWAGIFLIFEWHLVWASGSGMETLMFILFILITLMWLLAGWKRWIALGALIGLSVWVRPDGITLIGPALMVILLDKYTWKQKTISATNLFIGFTLLFSLYVIFNRGMAGAWWPNTFYAKQAEYAIELNDPLLRRLLEQAVLPLVGAGIVLLPGFVYYLRVAIAKRNWAALSGAIWAIGYLLVYALRLPVTYQHGRYVIPMMPVYYLWGFAGLVLWIQPHTQHSIRRVVSRAWVLSFVIVLVVFWIIGARAYTRDVAVIESEMVDTAHWIAENTKPDDLIAAHDIGALGYFGGRDILDLAGLVSPEVIPFIREEHNLAKYLDNKGADLLVTFPGWYPHLVKEAEVIYSTDALYSPFLGGGNMQVYKWPSGD